MRTGIALGSNLGERLQHLAEAKERIQQIPGVVALGPVSSVFSSDPVDCPPGSPEFYNAVLELTFDGEPLALLDALQRIEVEMGRPSAHGVNAPRTIDLDILYMGELVLKWPRLVIPHPRLQHRRFVLEPLVQIAPELVLPESEKPMEWHFQELQSGERPLIMVSETW
ncbi:2-amino-4-hydroxy-6-hydroxymethyldihydropteridine diphosphokinase [Rubritalea marina]|uniref:2-amino-4-hydroxy-6- hydroxymethyldihydropteridine diphosphokinase n=1 Tax=Rubritalea marina TaxID=361055 RepID=UPI000373C6D8|nr:2-amino-4-hydroxy-6-hydroxymethyldihydropteridine diphosphokinase [Rubritalea marina]